MSYSLYRRGAAIAGAAVFALAAPMAVALAQAGDLPPGVTAAQAEAALADLSAVYGQSISTVAQAKAVCNLERFMADCAEVGKRHGLYREEETRQVDAVLAELKGRTADDLKRCTDETCLVSVANRLAAELARKSPAVARTLELTPEKVNEKRTIVETAKEIGVNIAQCRAMDPNAAPVGELRACARLAQHERVQRLLPAEARQAAAANDKALELKEALSQGQYQCGDGTLDGCGNFCLNPSAEARAAGATAIPSVCRAIAERYFGPDGVRQLETAYNQVRQAATYFDRRAENVVFTAPDGRTLTDPAAIGRYLETEGQRGNVEAVSRGMDFLVTQGFIKPQDRDFATKMVERIRSQGGEIDFDTCSQNPESCRTFVPEEHRDQFQATAEVDRIMREEMARRGVADPARCAESPEIGQECVAASRAALPRVEPVARRSPEARAVVESIRRNVELADQSISARRRAEAALASRPEGLAIGDRTFTSFAEMDAFCRTNGTTCLAEAARRGIVEHDYAARRFERAVEVQFTSQPAAPPPLAPRPTAPATLPGGPTAVREFTPGRPLTSTAISKEEALRQFAQWLENPEGPPPIPHLGREPFGPGVPRPITEGPGPIQPSVCPAFYPPRPCAPGEYREEGRDARGCFTFGACVPIPGLRETRPEICPALPTVDSCPAGGERFITFSSPACGTYYGCRPAPVPQPHTCPAIAYRNAPGCYVLPAPDGCSVERCPGDPGYEPPPTPQPVPPGAITFPYRFANGRTVNSWEEARSYCLANGPGSGQGIAAECESRFGVIYGPGGNPQCADGRDNDADGKVDYPQDTGCYGPDDNDEAIPSVTSRCVYYTQETCNNDVVCKWANNGCGSKAQCNDGVDNDNDGLIDYPSDPGCVDHFANNEGGGTPTPGGQREQIWNSFGLRSWVRSDADAARIGELKQSCANVPSGATVWLPRSGDASSPDFGMPDPAKCRIAASCVAGQYFDGTACVASGSPDCSRYGTGWHVMGDNNCYDSEMKNYRTANGTLYSCATTPASGCSSTGGTSPQCSDGRDNDGDGFIDYPADTGCYGPDDQDEVSVSTTPGTASCPSGYHSYLSGSASHCMSDSNPSLCQPVGGGAAYTCPSSTATPTCPSGQYWNGSACASSTTTTPPPSSLNCPSGYHYMGDAAGGYCMSDSSSSTCQPLGGGAAYTCPGSTTTGSAQSCPSGQYWSGTACVSSTTPPPSSTSTSCPTGYYWNGSSCAVSSTPPSSSASCPSGQYWNGSSCVSSTPPPEPPPPPPPPPESPPPPPPSSARQTDQLLADIAASLAEISRLLGQLH